MARLIKHLIGWGIFGVIIATEFVLAVAMTNIVIAIYLLGGTLMLAILIIAAVTLINS